MEVGEMDELEFGVENLSESAQSFVIYCDNNGSVATP